MVVSLYTFGEISRPVFKKVNFAVCMLEFSKLHFKIKKNKNKKTEATSSGAAAAWKVHITLKAR